MKNLVLSTLAFLLSTTLLSQAPEFQRFNYQGVLSESGLLLSNTNLDVRFTIRQNTANGPIEYRETHQVSTNDQGMFSAVVGDGTAVTGSIISLGFTTSYLYLQVQVDIGSGYVNLGTSQIGSVPMANRALFAEFDEDNQTLSVSGQTLSIDGGNTVTLPSLWSTSGNDTYRTTGNVGIGTSNPEDKAHVAGNLFVQSNLGAFKIGYPDDGDQWVMRTYGSGADLAFASKADGASTTSNSFYLAQNGHVAIGDNTNPDQDLVVGSNIGTGWDSSLNVITAGGTGTIGGALEVGNEVARLVTSASSAFGRGRIISSTGSGSIGYGEGEIEMRTNGLYIGETLGEPESFTVKIRQTLFGLDLENENELSDWELYTASGSTGDLWLLANGTNRGQFNHTTGAYSQTSDRRLKTDIQPVESVLAKVALLEPCTYEYKDNNPDHIKSIGFIAQDVKELFPELVTVTDDKRMSGVHSMDYAGMSVVAISAIQEQQAEIEELKALLTGLQEQIEALKK